MHATVGSSLLHCSWFSRAVWVKHHLELKEPEKATEVSEVAVQPLRSSTTLRCSASWRCCRVSDRLSTSTIAAFASHWLSSSNANFLNLGVLSAGFGEGQGRAAQVQGRVWRARRGGRDHCRGGGTLVAPLLVLSCACSCCFAVGILSLWLRLSLSFLWRLVAASGRIVGLPRLLMQLHRSRVCTALTERSAWLYFADSAPSASHSRRRCWSASRARSSR
jgi:hypothetical protein